MKKMTLFLLAAVLALTACSAGKKKNDSAAAFAETAAVTAGEPAAKALLEEAAAALEISFAPEDSAQAVTGDIRLPVGGLHGCAVSWDSDRPEIISRTGTVTRPYDNGVTVNLTATLALEEYRVQKIIPVFVSPVPTPDTTPPTITVRSEVTVSAGGTVSYRSGLTVTDDTDPDPAVEIDTSAVNLYQPGDYKVIYKATDKAGNVATARMTVHVLALDTASKIAKRDEEMQKVLKSIINDQMTAAQKGKAIFDWVNKNISWAGNKSERGLVDAGYVAFVRKSGDCYVYYAAAKLMLDACGIPNADIERHTTSDHYWLLVDLGTGWYHYDPSPKLVGDTFKCFMKTDEEVHAYAASRRDGRTDYYDFDPALYTAYPRQTAPFAG